MGIIEKVRKAETKKEARKLVEEAKTWKYISPKTLRKAVRLAKNKRQ